MALVSMDVAASRLAPLIEGLLFVSESDRPLRVVQLGPLRELDESSLLRALSKPESTLVTRHSLHELFARTVTVQPWHGAAERVIVQRYRALVDFLNTSLSDSRVFRIGHIEVEAYALGKTSDERWLGVATTLIET